MKVKAGEIIDAHIDFVSMVKKAANKKKFLVCKADDGKAAVEMTAKVIKTDAQAHHITGVVYEPNAMDVDGNFMCVEEIKKAAYGFAKSSDKVDLQHSFEAESGVSVVESYVAPCDIDVDGTAVVKGSWVMTVQVEDENIWAAVEKGEYTGFSMGGAGTYVENASTEGVKKADELEPASKEKHSVLKAIAGLFGYDVVQKGEVKAYMQRGNLNELFWDAQSALRSALTDGEIFTSDVGKIKAALAEYSEIVLGILTQNTSEEDINKEKENKNKMEKNEVQELVKKEFETLKGELGGIVKAAIEEQVGKIAKAGEETPPAPEEQPLIKAEDIAALVSKSVADALEPVLKMRGLPSQLDGEQGAVEKAEQHYLAGIF